MGNFLKWLVVGGFWAFMAYHFPVLLVIALVLTVMGLIAWGLSKLGVEVG